MHYCRSLLIAVVLAAALCVSLNLNPLHAQDDAGPLVIEAGDYRLQIDDLWLVGNADDEQPSPGKYLVLDITLFNDSSSNVCFHDRHFTAKVPGPEDQPPEVLRKAQSQFFRWRDYPGEISGQCLDTGESELSLLEYYLPDDIEAITLRFAPEDKEGETILLWTRQAAGERGGGVITLSMSVDAPIEAAPTLALPATPTLHLNAVPQATSAPLQTATPPSVGTRYISATSNVNVRSCASTACTVVTLLAPGSAFSVLGSEHGWYAIALADGRTGYVADFLTSASRSTAPVQPAAPRQPVQPPTQADINADPPAQQDTAQEQPAAPPAPAPEQPISTPPPAAPAFVCDCSKTCPMMVSCEEAYFQLNQCGCGRRDGDGDGVPCEDICPGG